MSWWKRLKSFLESLRPKPLSPFEQAVLRWWSSLSVRQQVVYMTKEEREMWLDENLVTGWGSESSNNWKFELEYEHICSQGSVSSPLVEFGIADPLKEAKRIKVSWTTMNTAYARAHRPPPPPPPPPVPAPTPESILAKILEKFGPSGPDETGQTMLDKFHDPIVPSDMSFEEFLYLYRPDEPRDVPVLACPNCRQPTKFPWRLDLEYATRCGGRKFINRPITVAEIRSRAFIPVHGEAMCSRCDTAVDCSDIRVLMVTRFTAHYVNALRDIL